MGSSGSSSRNCVHPSVSSRDLILTPRGPQGDDALESVQPPPADPVDADHNQDTASGKAPVQAVPAVALVRSGGPGDTDVPVDVVPLNAGLAEPEFLAEGVHPGHALLEVAAGPDVSEEGHAVRLRFIRTGRNTKMTLGGHAEQSGVSYAESDRGVSEARSSSVAVGPVIGP